MKHSRRLIFQSIRMPMGLLMAGLSTFSYGAPLYWDTNGAASGSTSGNSGGGANAWGPHSVWSSSAAGDVATTGYTQGSDVFFSAGTNATGASIVRINGAQSANSIAFEEGIITLSSGNASGDFQSGGGSLSIGAGGLTLADGLHGNATIAAGLGTVILETSQTWTNSTTTTARQLIIETGIAGTATAGNTTTLTLGGASTAENSLLGVIGDGANGGALAITKTGASVYLFNGTVANTYTGLTTVSGGVLGLNRTAGINSIAGNISITGGSLEWRQHNQVADTSKITTSGGRINFNGRTETLDSVTLGGGALDTGNQGTANLVTITNAVDMSNSSKLTVNSGGKISVGSLSLTGNRNALAAANGGNILLGGGSTSVISSLTVGAGGLSMSGQDIQFNLSATGGLGSQIILNGDFTGSGTNNIGYGTGAGNMLSSIQLGAVDRTFNITSGVTSVSVPIAGTGSVLKKEGTGVLSLYDGNSYSGLTSINTGAIRLYHNNALGSSSAGTEVAAGAALGLYNSITVTGETLKLTGVPLSSSSSAGLVNGGGDNVWTGNLTLDVSVSQNVRINSAAGTLDIRGDVFIDGGTAAASGVGLVLTGGGGVATISGNISATGNNQNLIKNGTSTWILSGTNTYSGTTRVDEGVLGISSVANNLGPSSAPINMGEAANTGTLRYSGSGETVTRGIHLRSGSTGGGEIEQAGTGSLNITGNITSNASTGSKTLILSGSTAGTGQISGSISNSSNSATNVTKAGTGIWRLSGAGNSYTGATTVTGGTLIASSSLNTSTSLAVSAGTFAYERNDVINNTAPVSLATGAVIQMNGFSDALGVLAVTGSAELALGGGNSIIQFTDSRSADWTSGVLSITGWSGLAAGGGSERVLFASQGLTTDQRQQVFFVDPVGFAPGTYDAVFLGDELVPGSLIPEPSTLALAAAGLGGLTLRRKRTSKSSTFAKHAK